MQTFEQALEECQLPREYNGETRRLDISRDIKILLQETPYANEREHFQKGLAKRVRQYFQSALGERYTPLSADILDLTRKVEVPEEVQEQVREALKERDDDAYHIDFDDFNLPLVVSAPYGKESWEQEIDIATSASNSYRTEEGTTTILLDVKTPLIPRKIKMMLLKQWHLRIQSRQRH